MRVYLLAVFLALAAPATADQAYTITLTDEQADVLAEHTRTQNTLAERAKKKGLGVAAQLTPAQILQRDVNGMIAGWEHFQAAGDDTKAWADKSPRAKARMCKRQGIAPAACPK